MLSHPSPSLASKCSWWLPDEIGGCWGCSPSSQRATPSSSPKAVSKPGMGGDGRRVAASCVPKTAPQPGQGPSRSSGAAPCPDGSAAAACRDAQRQGDVPRTSLVFPSTQKHGKRRGGETYFGCLPCFSSLRGFNQGPVKPTLFIPALQPLFCSFFK